MGLRAMRYETLYGGELGVRGWLAALDADNQAHEEGDNISGHSRLLFLWPQTMRPAAPAATLR